MFQKKKGFQSERDCSEYQMVKNMENKISSVRVGVTGIMMCN